MVGEGKGEEIKRVTSSFYWISIFLFTYLFYFILFSLKRGGNSFNLFSLPPDCLTIFHFIVSGGRPWSLLFQTYFDNAAWFLSCRLEKKKICVYFVSNSLQKFLCIFFLHHYYVPQGKCTLGIPCSQGFFDRKPEKEYITISVHRALPEIYMKFLIYSIHVKSTLKVFGRVFVNGPRDQGWIPGLVI